MPAAPDLLARIDHILVELAALRAELAEQMPPTPAVNGFDTGGDDFAPESLIDTCAAAARFNYPQDCIRRWCREEGIGIRRGGRWLVSTRRLRARLRV